MNRQILLTCAGALALALNLPLSAAAAIPGAQSDQNLRWARSRIEFDIDQLQRDQHDYDGHRVRAIEDLQDARYQLDVALAYDHNRGDAVAAVPYAPGWVVDNRSDVNLGQVRRDVENVIDNLQRDDRDYGGHRSDAVSMLQAGRQQLDEALRTDGRH